MFWILSSRSALFKIISLMVLLMVFYFYLTSFMKYNPINVGGSGTFVEDHNLNRYLADYHNGVLDVQILV